MNDNRTLRYAIMVSLIAVYAAARLWRLTDSCLWFDEIFSVHAAEHSWNSILNFVALDLIHPPLFYVLLKFWIGVGGEGLLWLRTLPVLFSVIAIFPLFGLGNELKVDRRAMSISLCFLAFNGSLIKYSQVLRMYTLLLCLALFSIWLFARYFNRGNSFIPLLLVNILLVYTHYYGWLVVVSELAMILIFQRVEWRRIVAMCAVVFGVFIPWLAAVIRASAKGSQLDQNIAWIQRPGLSELYVFAIDFIEPFYFQASNIEPSSIFWVSIPLMAILLTAAGLFVAMPNRVKTDKAQQIYFLLVFSVLPLLIAFVASWLLPYSVWGMRHLIIIAAPVTILIATTITNLPGKSIFVAAIGLICLLYGAAFYLQARREPSQYVWCSWERIAGELNARSDETTPTEIYAFENLSAYHLWFSLRHSSKFQISAINGVEGMIEDEMYFLPRGFDQVKQANLSDITERTVWLAYRSKRPGQSAPMLNAVRGLGYTTCTPTVMDYDLTKVFLLKITKDAIGCSDE